MIELACPFVEPLLQLGSISIFIACLWIVIKFFFSLDADTARAGSKGQIWPITTLIMFLIYIFTRPEKIKYPMILFLIGLIITSFSLYCENQQFEAPNQFLMANNSTKELEDKPDTPYPQSPIKNSIFSPDDEIMLTWLPAANNIEYQGKIYRETYHIDEYSNWQSNTFLNFNDIFVNEFSDWYYWSVKARNSEGVESDWSSTWNFWIDSEPILYQSYSKIQQREPYYAISDCAPTRLFIGDYVEVFNEGGNGLFVRSYADTHPADNILITAPNGSIVTIIDGPVCNWGWILWMIRIAPPYWSEVIDSWMAETDGKEFWLNLVKAEPNSP